MNNQVILIVFILLIGSLSAWKIPSYYQNAVNLSVANWSYVATYGANSFVEAPTPYVLVKMVDAGNPSTYSIVGYSASGEELGNINYSVVNYVGQNAFILLSNKTNAVTLFGTIISGGRPWYTASIFYNRVGSPVIASTLCVKLCPVIQFSTSPYAINGLAQYFNLTLNTTYSNIFVGFGQPFGTISPLGFAGRYPEALVIMANKSLIYENFNITFYPDIIHGFNISAHNGLAYYTLKDLGINGNSLIQLPTNSMNAGNVFGNNDYDFEAYLGAPPSPYDQLVSEQFRFNTENGFMSNIAVRTNSISAIPNIFLNRNARIQIITTNYIRFVITPAFTTNYLLGSILTNNQASSSQIKDFQTYLSVSNIIWQHKFRTFAFPSNSNTAYDIINGQNNVPFLRISLPPSPDYGVGCEGLYLNTTDNGDTGSIPFSVLNCTTNPTLIIQNLTTQTNVYNSLKVWYNSFNNSNFGYSSPVVFNNYQLKSGATINQIYQGNTPFIITLSQPLNINSVVSLNGNLFMSYNGFDFVAMNNIAFGSIDGNWIDTNTSSYSINNRKLLITWRNDGQSVPSLHTRTLSINGITASSMRLYNISFNTLSSNPEPPRSYVNVALQSPLTANINKLYSNTYLLSAPTYRNNTAPIIITNGLVFPVTSINYLAVNQVLTILPNISFPYWTLMVMVIIIMLLSGFLLTHQHQQIGFALIFIVMYFVGISTFLASGHFEIVAVAIILTLLFILYEFTPKRKDG